MSPWMKIPRENGKGFTVEQVRPEDIRLATENGATIVRGPGTPSLREAVNMAREGAGQAIGIGPGGGKFITDPQTMAMIATGPMGGASMLARAGVGALTAGATAAAEGHNVLGNAALAAIPEPAGKGLEMGANTLKRAAMKTSLGRAAVGSVEKALKYGLAPTEKFLDFVKTRIGALKTEATAGANSLEAAGHSTTFDELSKPLRGAKARYGRSDVTGTETQDALGEILGEMKNKIGTPSPAATQAAAKNLSADMSARRTPVWKSPTGKPIKGLGPNVADAVPDAITPTQLQEINEIAGDKLKQLFEAKQGKLGAAPDPRRELGIMKVWSQSKRLLEGMGGDVGKSVGKANSEMQNLYKMDILARKAGERAHAFTGIEKAAAGSGVIGGAIAHNPAAAVASVPLMLALHGATSPEGMAAMARGLHSPLGQALARGAPRAGAVGIGQFLNQ